MSILLLILILTSCNRTHSVLIESQIQLNADDQQKIIELINKHILFSNDNNFEEYKKTIYPEPNEIIDNPVFTVWNDSRNGKVILNKITFYTQDNIGRPRVIAGVDWNEDRLIQVSIQQFNDEWKIVGMD